MAELSVGKLQGHTCLLLPPVRRLQTCLCEHAWLLHECGNPGSLALSHIPSYLNICLRMYLPFHQNVTCQIFPQASPCSFLSIYPRCNHYSDFDHGEFVCSCTSHSEILEDMLSSGFFHSTVTVRFIPSSPLPHFWAAFIPLAFWVVFSIGFCNL